MQGLASRGAANTMTLSEIEAPGTPAPLAEPVATPVQTKQSTATAISAPLIVERSAATTPSKKQTERAATVVGNGDSFAAAERIGGRVSMEVSSQAGRGESLPKLRASACTSLRKSSFLLQLNFTIELRVFASVCKSILLKDKN